jgi:hypothetical protein
VRLAPELRAQVEVLAVAIAWHDREALETLLDGVRVP